MIQDRAHRKRWMPIKIGCIDSVISYLFFAYNHMLFSQTNSKQVAKVIIFQNDFATTSGCG